ncbi:hypothetical protein [Vibrio harveyi]|uniref:hypothetical protein n=1 Tax=Vibrio harveyi TaxID=669 RepID=UPI0013C2BDA5|nr:hypothetical protein [Vibrio harveyi]
MPPLRESEIPLARCSDASLTRTLRRAGEVSEDRKLVPKLLISAAPTPTHFDSILSELDIVYGRFLN